MNLNEHCKRHLTVLAIAASGSAAVVAAPSYRIIDLGVLPGTTACYPHTITDDRVVTGKCGPGTGQAFRWSPARGMEPMPLEDPIVFARNNKNEVVGQRLSSDGSGAYLVAARGHLPDYFLAGTWAEEVAYFVGINDKGTVIGASRPSGDPVPWMWTKSKGLSELFAPPPGTMYSVTRVNNLNQVSGHISDLCSDRAFVYDARSARMQYIGPGTLPKSTGDCGLHNFATGINDVGQIVGYGNTRQLQFEFKPYVWTEATGPVEMKNENSNWGAFYPTDINNNGQVVGVFNEGTPGTSRSFY